MDQDKSFFQIVEARNRDRRGRVIDPGLMRRLQHPVCRSCQENYRIKFPGEPFKIICNGIYGEDDFQEISEATGMPLEQVREAMDVVHWASKYVRVVNEDGDLTPFVARDYQQESLRCTAQRQVDRWGRGMGKTMCGVIRELHTAITRRNYRILIICPAQSQSQTWFDEILKIIDASPELASSLAGKIKQPFFRISFTNKSTISIFTAGSQSGRRAASVRGQSPNRVRIDEQDQLDETDWVAISPLLRRYADSEFHGSSTPTGARGTFYKMCREFPDYRELHFPITRHPNWGPAMLEACRREARTEQNFLHEFMAEFGDLESGVFPADLVTRAKKPYRYEECRPQEGWRYFLGVDWNGRGVGTRLRVIGYDPATKIRRVVAAETVDDSTDRTLQRIMEANRRWACEKVYLDHGYGYVQDEILRKLGATSDNPIDRRLVHLQTIDFGAKLVTNRLVSRREGSKYLADQELERPTKPFMVEGLLLLLEQGLFEFSEEDFDLESQLREYRVKTFSRQGWANQYESKVGDHDLDAVMLAALGVEMAYGLTSQKSQFVQAAIRHVPPPQAPQGEDPRIRASQQAAGIPSRSELGQGVRAVQAGDAVLLWQEARRMPASSYQVLGPRGDAGKDPQGSSRIPGYLLRPARRPGRF